MEHIEKCRKKAFFSLHPCGWPNNSIFWRKKYYGWISLIYAFYFWTIYLPSFLPFPRLIVEDLKSITSSFLPCYCCCSTVQWDIFPLSLSLFMLYDFMFHLLLLCMECVLLLIPSVRKSIFVLFRSPYCCVAAAAVAVDDIAKLKSWNIFMLMRLLFTIKKMFILIYQENKSHWGNFAACSWDL